MNAGTPFTTGLLKQTFDAVSAGYDRNVLRFFGESAQRLATCLELKGDERVLDVATGTGHLALALARRLSSGRVTGIDFSAGMLEQARCKAEAAQAHNVEFIEMDMLELEFPEATFDLIVCAFGVFFAEDMEAQLARMMRSLKPGGTLATTSFDECYFSPLKEMMAERLTRCGATMPPQTWRRIANEPGCRALFAAADLSQVRVEHWDCGYYLAGAEEWWEVIWNAGFRRWVCQLAPSDRERFKGEHLREVETLRTPQGIWLNVGVLATVGEKEP